MFSAAPERPNTVKKRVHVLCFFYSDADDKTLLTNRQTKRYLLDRIQFLKAHELLLMSFGAASDKNCKEFLIQLQSQLKQGRCDHYRARFGNNLLVDKERIANVFAIQHHLAVAYPDAYITVDYLSRDDIVFRNELSASGEKLGEILPSRSEFSCHSHENGSWHSRLGLPYQCTRGTGKLQPLYDTFLRSFVYYASFRYRHDSLQQFYISTDWEALQRFKKAYNLDDMLFGTRSRLLQMQASYARPNEPEFIAFMEALFKLYAVLAKNIEFLKPKLTSHGFEMGEGLPPAEADVLCGIILLFHRLTQPTLFPMAEARKNFAEFFKCTQYITDQHDFHVSMPLLTAILATASSLFAPWTLPINLGVGAAAGITGTKLLNGLFGGPNKLGQAVLDVKTSADRLLAEQPRFS